MQACGQVIEVIETSWNPRDPFLSLGEAINKVKTLFDDIVERSKRPSEFALGEAEHRPFGKIQQIVHRRSTVVSTSDYFGRGADKTSEQRFVAHNFAMVLDVGRGRHRLNQFR